MSTNESQTSSNLIRSNYSYDIYEYTPTLGIDETTDSVQDDPEKSGLMFQGEIGVTTYTIKFPRIHDIVSFSYAPYTTDHIYRVKGISSVLNIQDAGIHISKLELEYAFNKSSIGDLSIIDEYVFSVYDNANILKSKYISIMDEQAIISAAATNLQYDEYNELYYYLDISGANIVPLLDNQIIFNSITRNNNIRQYFSDLKAPYGTINYPGVSLTDYYNLTTKTLNAGLSQPIPVSAVTSISSYVLDIGFNLTTDIAKLLTLFQG